MEPKGYEQWYGNWTYMVVATLIFGVFTLALLRPRKKRDWRGAGVLQAFFISLFAEMKGVTKCRSNALGISKYL
jgi:hypothetical protein